ncbi:MAG: hypothetical protein A2252_04485 [Elusimicrobia bacterium RIFOXYA2_FULL_39_19]|nr:MAG: hypothetical protein A2252_04485 [Elusimicrobia bacterium RIFOXYA2_FULL_39_19]
MPKVPIGSKQRSRSEEYFKEYVGMGVNRTYAGLTAQLQKKYNKKISISTIEHMAAKHEWQARLLRLEKTASQKHDAKIVDRLSIVIEMQRKLLSMQLSSLLRSFQQLEKEGRLPKFTYLDMIRVMQYEWEIEGGNKPAAQVPFNPVSMEVNIPQEIRSFVEAIGSLPTELRNRVVLEMDGQGNRFVKNELKAGLEEIDKENKETETNNE